MERDDVVRAVRESKNLSDAAHRLDMSRRTLQSRMRLYGLPRGKAGRPRQRFNYHKRSSSAITTVLAIAAVVVVGIVARKVQT